MSSADRQREDAALMAAAQAGDRDAFAALFCRHKWEIHCYLVRNLNHPAADVDDAEGTVWLRAWARRHSYRPMPGASVRSWIYAIARNHIFDLSRRRWHRNTWLDETLEHPPAVAPCGTAPPDGEQRVLAREVREAVAALTPEQAAVVAWRWLEDQSVETTAARIGIAPDAVRQRQARGFRRLRKSLAAYGPDAADDDAVEEPAA